MARGENFLRGMDLFLRHLQASKDRDLRREQLAESREARQASQKIQQEQFGKQLAFTKEKARGDEAFRQQQFEFGKDQTVMEHALKRDVLELQEKQFDFTKGQAIKEGQRKDEALDTVIAFEALKQQHGMDKIKFRTEMVNGRPKLRFYVDEATTATKAEGVASTKQDPFDFLNFYKPKSDMRIKPDTKSFDLDKLFSPAKKDSAINFLSNKYGGF